MGTHASDTSVGVGPENDNRASEGSQRASGGSGGEQMTRSLHDTHSDAPVAPAKPGDDDIENAPEGAGLAATHTTRGPLDTHSHQAGGTKTGLGVPETGGNQDPADLAPPQE